LSGFAERVAEVSGLVRDVAALRVPFERRLGVFEAIFPARRFPLRYRGVAEVRFARGSESVVEAVFRPFESLWDEFGRMYFDLSLNEHVLSLALLKALGVAFYLQHTGVTFFDLFDEGRLSSSVGVEVLEVRRRRISADPSVSKRVAFRLKCSSFSVDGEYLKRREGDYFDVNLYVSGWRVGFSYSPLSQRSYASSPVFEVVASLVPTFERFADAFFSAKDTLYLLA